MRPLRFSHALAVAEKGDVEAVAEAPTVAETLLEGGGDDPGHGGGGDTEGHKKDIGGAPADKPVEETEGKLKLNRRKNGNENS